MFDTLKRLILPDTSLHCPRCDKSLEGHDEAACARRMSRRFFFQVAAGAAVVVAAAPSVPKSLAEMYRTGTMRPGLGFDWLRDGLKIGDTTQIRKPHRFLISRGLEFTPQSIVEDIELHTIQSLDDPLIQVYMKQHSRA